jgi:DNA-binding NtrC family response regulator
MKNRPLIVVVDDDAMILKLIESDLKTLDAEVVSFRYGEDFLPQLHLNPRLVILDFIFVNGDKQVLSGLEILQEIRRLKPDLPVIILSGQESGSTVLELIKLGIEEYIIKEKNFTSKLKEAVIGILEDE